MDKKFWAFVFFLVMVRFAMVSPFDAETRAKAEAYYTEDGRRLETGLNQLGNLVFYFPLELEDCFKPMDEILFYQQVVDAYPNLSYALTFYDPSGEISTAHPDLKNFLKARFHYVGPYFFDRDDSVLNRYSIINEPRIFIFNDHGRLLNILSPADTLGQKARVRYYFEVAREHL